MVPKQIQFAIMESLNIHLGLGNGFPDSGVVFPNEDAGASWILIAFPCHPQLS